MSKRPKSDFTARNHVNGPLLSTRSGDDDDDDDDVLLVVSSLVAASRLPLILPGDCLEWGAARNVAKESQSLVSDNRNRVTHRNPTKFH